MLNFSKVVETMGIEQDHRLDEEYLTTDLLLEDEQEPECMGDKEKHMSLRRFVIAKKPDTYLVEINVQSATSSRKGSNRRGTTRKSSVHSSKSRSASRKLERKHSLEPNKMLGGVDNLDDASLEKKQMG